MLTIINKIIPLWLKEKSIQGLWLLIAFLITICWSLSEKNIFLQTILQLEDIVTVKIGLSLLFLSFGLSSSLFILHKKPKQKDYEIINPPGFMRHKKTGAYYCQPCLLSKHIAIELSPISTKEMLCRLCKETYKIDYNVLICDAYISKAHDRAVNVLIHGKENG